MLRLTALLRRNPSLTHDEFLRHWREEHAPLMAIPEIARHVVAYEQHAVAPGLPDWAGSPGWDGVTVQVFADLDGFLGFLAEPAYRELVAPDEDRLLDKGATQWLLTEDPVVVVAGPTGGGGSTGAASVAGAGEADGG